jgi:hypothetical protein
VIDDVFGSSDGAGKSAETQIDVIPLKCWNDWLYSDRFDVASRKPFGTIRKRYEQRGTIARATRTDIAGHSKKRFEAISE